jgi:predicted Fe-S protein YdhL (DUF1289 family)
MNAETTLNAPASRNGSAPASPGAAAERPCQPEAVPPPRDFSVRANKLQTLLQQYWLHILTEAQRDEWRDRFNPPPGVLPQPQQVLIDWMAREWQLPIKWHHQLTTFREWLNRQEEASRHQGILDEEEAKVIKGQPELSFQQIRDLVLQRAYFRVLNNGDFKFGLQIIRHHMQLEKLYLDHEKQQLNITVEIKRRLSALLAIRNNSQLTEEEQLEALRQELFGSKADWQPNLKTQPPTTETGKSGKRKSEGESGNRESGKAETGDSRGEVAVASSPDLRPETQEPITQSGNRESGKAETGDLRRNPPAEVSPHSKTPIPEPKTADGTQELKPHPAASAPAPDPRPETLEPISQSGKQERGKPETGSLQGSATGATAPEPRPQSPDPKAAQRLLPEDYGRLSAANDWPTLLLADQAPHCAGPCAVHREGFCPNCKLTPAEIQNWSSATLDRRAQIMTNMMGRERGGS